MELRDNEGDERNEHERKGRGVVSWWKWEEGKRKG